MDINTGDTAWVLTSAALVLFMTPGLALFYGGMVRAKSVLNMMMMSFIAMATISVAWVLWGYSETFGSSWHGLVGNPFEHAGLSGVLDAAYGSQGHLIPGAAFVAFQVVFAIIAVALISGAIADRARFLAWTVFTVVWATVVYFPVAHWVFAFDGYAAPTGGWIANGIKAVDFAGGTAIHINAGAAGLALALVLGARTGFAREPMRPHNLTLVMTGAGILWFGWFVLIVEGAIPENVTGLAFREEEGSFLVGAVAGLVAITPSCSTLSPAGSVLLGLVAGAGCAMAVGLKYRFGVDDSLDVVGVHLVGGLIGTVGVGFLATRSGSPAGDAGVDGLFYGGGADQLWRQSLGAVAVLAFSFVVTYLIARVIHATLGFRVTRDDEMAGIDQSEHAETAYDLGGLAAGRMGVGALLVAAGSAPDPRPRSLPGLDTTPTTGRTS